MTTETATMGTAPTVPGIELLSQFEVKYADARAAADPRRIPWNDGISNPLLVKWLDAEAPAVLRCGSRVAVVGCGLGHDARELMQRGYEVTAFDISTSAIAWARQLDPDNASHYLEANVLEPPARWVHRFDLVVEINTIQSLPSDAHPAMFDAIARLVGMRGHLLTICRGSDAPVGADDGPPWALTETELLDLGHGARLVTDRVERFIDNEEPPKLRFRALFRRD